MGRRSKVKRPVGLLKKGDYLGRYADGKPISLAYILTRVYRTLNYGTRSVIATSTCVDRASRAEVRLSKWHFRRSRTQNASRFWTDSCRRNRKSHYLHSPNLAKRMPPNQAIANLASSSISQHHPTRISTKPTAITWPLETSSPLSSEGL